MIKVWITRDESGYYSMWGLRPVLAKIAGSLLRAWYGRVREPVGWRGMCAAVVASLSRGTIRIDPAGGPIRVYAVLIPEDRMNPELKSMIIQALS